MGGFVCNSPGVECSQGLDFKDAKAERLGLIAKRLCQIIHTARRTIPHDYGNYSLSWVPAKSASFGQDAAVSNSVCQGIIGIA